MAIKSSTMSTVTATFLHSTTLLLVQILLFSFVRGDIAVCDNFCPPVSSVEGWQTECYLQSSVHCGESVVSDVHVPSAPSKLKVQDYTYEVQGTTLLALNITWVLPVTGNFFGLEGFYVDVRKTSYPVGYNVCNAIRFDHPLAVSSFASEIVFQFSCLRRIDVDSHFNITITSIGLKEYMTLDHHTSSCAMIPGVGRCPTGIDPDDEWKPSQVPTTLISGDSVAVLFTPYPGDRWITYKINLRPCNGDATPSALSQIVDTKGAFERYSFRFSDVPPGCYIAHVTLHQRPDGSIVDGYESRSERFYVTLVTVRPPGETTKSPDADETTVSVVSTPSLKPEEVHTTQAAVTEKNEYEEGTKPGSKTILYDGLIGAGVGIAVAVLLLLTFVVKKRQRSKRESETASSQETPTDYLVNNMVPNDSTVPGNNYDVYGRGDSVSVFQSDCRHCCDHANFPDNPEDFNSVTNMSGVTV